MRQTAFGMMPTEADGAQVVLAPSRVIGLSTPTTHTQNPRETADPAVDFQASETDGIARSRRMTVTTATVLFVPVGRWRPEQPSGPNISE